MQLRTIIPIAVVVGSILLVPLLGGLLTDDVNWSLVEFIVAGVPLFGTGLALAWIAGRFSNPVHRVIAGAAVVGVLLLIWAELAVGIFGTPFAGS